MGKNKVVYDTHLTPPSMRSPTTSVSMASATRKPDGSNGGLDYALRADEDNQSPIATPVEGSQITESAGRASRVETLSDHESIAKDRYDALARKLDNHSMEMMLLKNQVKQWEEWYVSNGEYHDAVENEGDNGNKGETTNVETAALAIQGSDQPVVNESTATFGSCSSTLFQSTTIATVLTTAVTKGSMKIEVACTDGMKVGQKIRIGNQVYEENIIAGFGSINLTTPLAQDHEAGDGVAIINEAPTVPPIDLSAVRQPNGEPYRTNEKAFLFVPTIPNIPKRRSELNTFHDELCDKVLQASTRNDNAEKDYLDLALSMSMTDARLDTVPPNMLRLDRMLRPELEKKCKSDPSLNGDLERIKREKSVLREPFTMMRVLVMIYHSLCNDKSMLDMYTIRDLTDVKYEEYGDSKVDLFWNKFLTVLARLDEPLGARHMRDCLYHEMKKSEELKIALRDYKKKAVADRTFEDLKVIITDFIHERREELALRREQERKAP
ncbi:MAG: hypothetical protein QF745_10565, partial [Planctomycetota bacterium]|nr:hypothetical protein [Planctomycetota bacterium]